MLLYLKKKNSDTEKGAISMMSYKCVWHCVQQRLAPWSRCYQMTMAWCKEAVLTVFKGWNCKSSSNNSKLSELPVKISPTSDTDLHRVRDMFLRTTDSMSSWETHPSELDSCLFSSVHTVIAEVNLSRNVSCWRLSHHGEPVSHW